MKKIVILIVLISCSLIGNAQKQQEAVSSIYHFRMENRAQILERLQANEAQRQALLMQQLNAFNQSMKPENRVGEGIKMEIQPSVIMQKSPEGRDEMNLELEFSYETKKDDEFHFTVAKNTDDYPAGAYLPTQSKACKTTLAFIKNKIDNELAEYFTKGTEVTIKITGETDGSAIRSAIPYKGEYGDFENLMIYLNNEIDEMT